MSPMVSIITVALNSRRLLEQTVAAVSALDYPAVEMVVVDGGSTDGSVECIRDNHAIAKWVSERDGGIFDAMNKGMAMADGDYVWFLNAGDVPARPDILRNIFADGVRHDYYYGDTQLIDARGEVVKTIYAPRALRVEDMWRGMQISHQSIIVRRSRAPEYDLNYRYVADQKWVIDVLESTTSGTRVRGAISSYLLGGVSQKFFGRCVADKLRLLSRELPPSRAALLGCGELAKAAKFYTAKALRRVRVIR